MSIVSIILIGVIPIVSSLIIFVIFRNQLVRWFLVRRSLRNLRSLQEHSKSTKSKKQNESLRNAILCNWIDQAVLKDIKEVFSYCIDANYRKLEIGLAVSDSYLFSSPLKDEIKNILAETAGLNFMDIENYIHLYCLGSNARKAVIQQCHEVCADKFIND